MKNSSIILGAVITTIFSFNVHAAAVVEAKPIEVTPVEIKPMEAAKMGGTVRPGTAANAKGVNFDAMSTRQKGNVKPTTDLIKGAALIVQDQKGGSCDVELVAAEMATKDGSVVSVAEAKRALTSKRPLKIKACKTNPDGRGLLDMGGQAISVAVIADNAMNDKNETLSEGLAEAKTQVLKTKFNAEDEAANAEALSKAPCEIF